MKVTLETVTTVAVKLTSLAHITLGALVLILLRASLRAAQENASCQHYSRAFAFSSLFPEGGDLPETQDAGLLVIRTDLVFCYQLDIRIRVRVRFHSWGKLL